MIQNGTNGQAHTHIADELAKNVAFVMVSIHRWRGQYRIKNALIQVANAELKKELVANPRWNLMPKKWHTYFTEVESHFQRCILQSSVLNPEDAPEETQEQVHSFPIRGVRLIPKKNLKKFFDTIKDVEENEFTPLVKSFGEEWADIREGIRTSVLSQPPVVWNMISSHLPKSGAEVVSKCWVEKIIIPVTLGQGSLDPIAGDAAGEYAAEIKAYGERFTAQVANTIIDGLESELTNAVDTLTERIKEGGIIKEGTINSVKLAFEKFKSFDFLMTDELRKKMAIVSATIGSNDCTDLNKDLKKSGATSMTYKLAEHLKVVRAQCVADSMAARVHGRGHRNIKV